MLVKWNHKGPLSFGHSHEKSTGIVTVLVPGINRVPEDQWAQQMGPSKKKDFKPHPVITTYMNEGKLSLVDKGNLDKPVEESHPDLALYDDAKAVEIVQDCYNMDLLKEWGSVEKRILVSRQIDKQIDSLKIKTKPKEG